MNECNCYTSSFDCANITYFCFMVHSIQLPKSSLFLIQTMPLWTLPAIQKCGFSLDLIRRPLKSMGSRRLRANYQCCYWQPCCLRVVCSTLLVLFPFTNTKKKAPSQCSEICLIFRFLFFFFFLYMTVFNSVPYLVGMVCKSNESNDKLWRINGTFVVCINE